MVAQRCSSPARWILHEDQSADVHRRLRRFQIQEQGVERRQVIEQTGLSELSSLAEECLEYLTTLLGQNASCKLGVVVQS